MSFEGMLAKAGIFSDGANIDIPGTLNAGNYPSMAHLALYVDANNGSDNYSGRNLSKAYATIQKAVGVANSPTYATQNVDIFVYGGLYSENVNFSRAGTELGSDTMLWTAGGTNVGSIGRIRLIAVGYVWLGGPVGVAQPTISICRPNVEIHNFSTIKCLSTETITKTNWTFAEGSTSVHMKMPVIGVSDDYNGSSLLNGAGNSVLINNCKINGGTGAGGILNNGGKWVNVTNCMIEYYTEYGIANVGSSKGTAAEILTRGCDFHQQGASSPALIHGQAVIWWVDACRFWDEAPSGGLLDRQAQNSASSFCWLTNCYAHDCDDFQATNNAGWDAAQIYTAINGGPLGSDDLTGDNWVTADANT